MYEYQGAILTAEELVRRRTKTDVVLPTKGPKSFSPSGSWLESKQLQSSLDATKVLIAEERVERENALAQAEWDENLKVARVTRVVGKQFEKFGHEENMSVFLYPEEALYLLETNHLQLMYGGVSMSIQQAYTVLIGPKTGCTFAEYMVFSHLLKNGFKVLRHCAKRTITRYEKLIGLRQQKLKNKQSKKSSNVPKVKKGDGKKRTTKEKNVEDKNEGCEKLERSKPSSQKVISEVKGGKTVENVNITIPNIITDSEFVVDRPMDGNLSSQSDIEILSERSACKTEESLDYITEYSSYSSEDSDCQVVFSSGADAMNANNEKFCSKSKVIEEINLSDSDESNNGRNNTEDSIQLKIETSEVEMLCNDIESKEYQMSREEQNNSNITIGKENFVEVSTNHGDRLTLQNNEGNNHNFADSVGSNVLMKNENVNEELVVEQTCEENNHSVIRFSGSERDGVDHEKMLLCVSEFTDVKQEIVRGNTVSAVLHNNVMFHGDGAGLIKNESDSNAHRAQKEQCDIEIIELDDEPGENKVKEDRDTILRSFPNSAGCGVVICDIPPSHLCPPNVHPFHLSYRIVIDQLQEPGYGGKPRGERKVRSHDNNARNYNRGRVKNLLNRYCSRPYRPFNRRCVNPPKYIENMERSNNYQDASRHESYHEQMLFMEQPPIHLPYQPTYEMQREQNTFPHFSGQPAHALPFYLHPRASFDHRGYNREMYNHNSHFREFPYRSPYTPRYPRRKGRGNRTVYHDHFVASCERDRNEVFDERERNYFPCSSSDNAEDYSYHEQERRTQDDTPNPKRFQRSCEENVNSASSSRKRSRYFSSTGKSHELMDFLQLVRSDNEENSTIDTAPIATGNYDFGNDTRIQEIMNESVENVHTLAADNSTDNTSSSGRSCGNSSAHGSSDDSMNESTDNEAEGCIPVLLKSNDMEDIDASLKSLEIVHGVKLKGLSALSHEPLLTIKFDLYQPSTPFRRSDPPVPDFRVVIMQPDQYLPTSRQLAFLGAGFNDDVPLLFAISSSDSVAFYFQSVVNLPHVSSKEKVQI